MGDIPFDEPEYIPDPVQRSGITAFLVTHNLVKDEAHATRLLVGLIIVACALAVLVFLRSSLSFGHADTPSSYQNESAPGWHPPQ